MFLQVFYVLLSKVLGKYGLKFHFRCKLLFPNIKLVIVVRKIDSIGLSLMATLIQNGPRT